MASTKNGVEHYAIGTATVKVAFANARICCRNCEFLIGDRGLGRAMCKLQHSKIIPLEFTDGIDGDCPLAFGEETK